MSLAERLRVGQQVSLVICFICMPFK